MAERVFNRDRSPRAAIIGFEDGDADLLAQLVPSPYKSDDLQGLGRPWDEIDVVVLDGRPSDRIPARLPLVYRPGESFRSPTVDSGSDWQLVQFFTDSVEVVAEAGDTPVFDAAIEDLAKATTTPHLGYRPSNTAWNRAFTKNRRGDVLGGEYRRGTRGSIGWVLPDHADIVSWFRLFLQRVHELEPARVPQPPPEWVPWDTAGELAIRREIDGLGSALIAENKRVLALIHEKQDELAEASRAAEAGPRRLLTSDGEDLADAVASTLRYFGFEVQNADETIEAGQGKREDLWITQDGETVIAEVKGYTKGASTGDLVAAKDYAITYAARHSRPPRAQWHIVNAFRGADPNTRRRLFEGHDDVVGSAGVLVIDTRDLFKLLLAVETGSMTNDRARAALWDAPSGFWVLPSVAQPA